MLSLVIGITVIGYVVLALCSCAAVLYASTRYSAAYRTAELLLMAFLFGTFWPYTIYLLIKEVRKERPLP